MVQKFSGLKIKLISLMVIAVFALLGQSFVMAQATTGEVEIVGTVSAITSTSITVGTQVFNISTAEIKAGVAVGALVKVHATQDTSGQWIAREVELSLPTAEQTVDPNVTVTPVPINAFEITGQITAITNSTITVGGHVIDLSGAEVKNSLAIGDQVKVHVIVLNNQWMAREVESASIPVTLTVSPNCTPTAPAGWVAYTVQAGDTLSSIAFGSGSNPQAVASANCISNPRSIQAGQTVLVPQQPVSVQPTRVGRGGQDDGANHDLNDDHGNSNGSDDGANHDLNDDHGNNSGSNDGGSHNSGDDGGSSGRGGSGSGEGSGHG